MHRIGWWCQRETTRGGGGGRFCFREAAPQWVECGLVTGTVAMSWAPRWGASEDCQGVLSLERLRFPWTFSKRGRSPGVPSAGGSREPRRSSGAWCSQRAGPRLFSREPRRSSVNPVSCPSLVDRGFFSPLRLFLKLLAVVIGELHQFRRPYWN